MTSAVVTGLGRRGASSLPHLLVPRHATLRQTVITPIASRVRLRNGHQLHQHQHHLQQRRHASDHARRPKTALFFPGAGGPLVQHSFSFSLSSPSCDASPVRLEFDLTLDSPRD